MPQSLSSVHLHAVFSTKNRDPLLADTGLRQDLHAYLGGVNKKLGCEPIAIGGIADHVHLLVRFGRTLSIAYWIKEVKRVSSLHLKADVEGFSWQAGYGVFAVEVDKIDTVADYVHRQEEHHRTVSFEDEFRELLRRHCLEWDERYVWD